MIKCSEIFHRKILVSGYFDPFHDMHLDYFEQAKALEGHVVCVVASDKQVLLKKGKVNIPEEGRREIVDLILTGMGVPHTVIINHCDNETTLIAKALELIEPDILFRGGDKTIEGLPLDEKAVCYKLGIDVLYGKFRADRHGARM